MPNAGAGTTEDVPMSMLPEHTGTLLPMMLSIYNCIFVIGYVFQSLLSDGSFPSFTPSATFQEISCCSNVRGMSALRPWYLLMPNFCVQFLCFCQAGETVHKAHVKEAMFVTNRKV